MKATSESVNAYRQKKQAIDLLAKACGNKNDSYRIDRIIANEYIKSKKEQEYNLFCLEWIETHWREFIESDVWDYDIPYSDEAYSLDVNTLIDKLHRKKAGSKF